MNFNYPQIAAAVYQACTTYDQYLPQLSADVAKSWAKVFRHSRLSADDLLAGVDRVYVEHGAGYRPLPADIARAGRAIREDRAQREDREQLEQREQAIDARVAEHVAELAAAKELPADVKYERPGSNPLLVGCSHCKASRYQPCTTHDGIPLRREPRYHQARVDALKELAS
jgi:hypothetical protein